MIADVQIGRYALCGGGKVFYYYYYYFARSLDTSLLSYATELPFLKGDAASSLLNKVGAMGVLSFRSKRTCLLQPLMNVL